MSTHREIESGTRDRAFAGDTDLLIEAGSVLASSLDVAATMQQVAELAVPNLADLCVIDRREDDGSIMGVAVAASRELARELEDLRQRFPLDPAGTHPVARVIRSGVPELLPEMSGDQLRSFARSPAHASFMIDHAYRTGIVAPLTARGRILGALSVLRLGDSASYDFRDLNLVVELARRAALAIDNARLYSDLRDAERRLEAIFASIAEAITVVNAQGRMVLANQAAADLLGCVSPQELINAEPDAMMARFIVRDEHGAELTLDAMPSRRVLRGEEAAPLLVQNTVRGTGEERWLIVRSTPVADRESGRVLYAVNVFENITELKRAELGEKFMSEASRLLASSMAYESTLARIARLAVPELADWCAIDLVRDGSVERVALHHVDAPKVQRAGVALSGEDGPAAEVIRTARSHVAEQARPMGASTTDADDRRGVPTDGAAPATVIVVPVLGVARTIGAVTLLSLGARRGASAREVALAERLARRIGTAVENARLYTERIELARTLQRALLPLTLPVVDGAELDARYLAASGEVGGDFYDVIRRGAGGWILVIGDVCGKGARAAALTALARHTLRAAAISGQAPRQMLRTLHEALRSHSPVSELCTVCLVVVEPERERTRLTVALAGHPPPLVIGRDRNVRPEGVPGTLLGAQGRMRPGLTETYLEPGETLLLYTDGVCDAGRPGNQLGEQGLAQACRDSSARSVAGLLEHIEGIALDRAAGKPRDDLALLGLRFGG
jgi:PAS domain S-box-containing protein